MNKAETDFNLFIPYSNKDISLVEDLANNLAHYGINVHRKLVEVSGNWEVSLKNEIAEAGGVLVLISPESISYNREVHKLACELTTNSVKLLIPVIYGGVGVPDFIQSGQVIYWGEDNAELIAQIMKTIENFRYIGYESTIQESPKSEQIINKKMKKSPIAKTKSNDKKDSPETEIPLSTKPNYWLLKINPGNWEIKSFKMGVETYFGTYHNDKKRPEYDLFIKIKKGDFILTYALKDYNKVVCVMEVTKPVHKSDKIGEVFEMKINNILHPGISLDFMQSKIPDIIAKLKVDKRPPEVFFQITEDIYNEILNYNENSIITHQQPLYQPFFLTEGSDQHKTEDQLGFQNDINSFASVITLKSVNPPLAIGLFGNWGSGKSFFMDKLYDCIEKIVKDKEPEAVQHIVQVKFNSWHYSDTSLWASLTTQIFESLYDYSKNKPSGVTAIEAMYKELDMTSLQIVATTKKIDANRIQVDSIIAKKSIIEDNIKEKKEKLDNLKLEDIAKAVFADKKIQDDFKKIKSDFNTVQLEDNIDKIEERFSEVKTIWRQIYESYLLLKETTNGKWIWVWIFAAMLAIIGLLVIYYFKEHIQYTIQGAVISFSFALGFITKIINMLKPHFKKITDFYNRLESLKNTIDKAKENKKLEEELEVDTLNKEIEDLKNERSLLDTEQKQAEDKKLFLTTQISEIGSGKLLANFLAERNADDAYIKQLGIISWIRRDFSKLNDFFLKQKAVQENENKLPDENGSKPQVQIDRIVLYIDDLDRCNEEVVVKVLEAIHLLLAFPLFVVVVGVDPRWLNNALSVKYKTLFGSKDDKNNSMITDVATSYDYLEKIFQIPFALKPINKTGRDKLIKYLIKDEMESDNSVVIPTNTKEQKTDKADEKMEQDEKEHMTHQQESGDTPSNSQNPEVNKGGQEEIKQVKIKLNFSNEELEYMQNISSLFGKTPRTINRYVNIYRIIKAHGNLQIVGEYSSDEFKPILLTLGVIVGYSTFAKEFINAISKSKGSETFNVFNEKAIINDQLKKDINALITTDIKIKDMPMENFKRNLDLILRFSFRILTTEDELSRGE